MLITLEGLVRIQNATTSVVLVLNEWKYRTYSILNNEKYKNLILVAKVKSGKNQ